MLTHRYAHKLGYTRFIAINFSIIAQNWKQSSFPSRHKWHTVSYLCQKQTVAYLNNIILFSNKNKQAIKHEETKMNFKLILPSEKSQ